MSIPVLRVGSFTPRQVVDVEFTDTLCSQPASCERLQHRRMVSWLVDVRVLTFDIKHDRGDSSRLSAMDERCHGRGLAATRSADHTCMSRKHRLVLRRDPGFHVLVPYDLSEAEVSSHAEDTRALLLI